MLRTSAATAASSHPAPHTPRIAVFAILLLARNHVNKEVVARSWVLAAVFSLAFAGAKIKAQTLRSPLPACQSLKLSVAPDTECFDDVDRDGKFQYDRGDRAFTAKTWIQYQWNLY